jgi:hypothetical protein
MTPEDRQNLKPPVDDKDRCAMMHDFCFLFCRQLVRGNKVNRWINPRFLACLADCNYEFYLCLLSIPFN